MAQTAQAILLLAGLAALLGLGGFALISHAEGERRASRVSLALAVAVSTPLLAAIVMPPPAASVALTILLGAGVVVLVLFLLPIGRIEVGNDTPTARFDERDITFARARLRSGTPEYESYYAMRPENRADDDATRRKPGLLSPRAKLANRFHFASAAASFELSDALREAVDGPAADEQKSVAPAEMTSYVKALARYYGALDVGVCALQPYHVYSHVGRGTGEYGSPLPVMHRYAVAFTVEMDFDMVGTAPEAQTVMESARQYVEAARVAVQLAGAIRALGHQARAHTDGNYRVIVPLVARDAGLGEIGRMGLLMTPRHGPRVRLGAVTTDLALVPDEREEGASVIDFCTICAKCAECCPSQSIPNGDREEVDGALRWRIDPDTCFRYWNVIGTDCARCMAVCPYSHPDTFSHNVVRWGLARSGFFRRAALAMDDLMYGKRPAARVAPEWTRVGD